MKGSREVTFDVLSLDAGRVRVEETSDGLIVCKRTTVREYRQMREAKWWLENREVRFTYEGETYRIVLPEVVTWTEEKSELHTSFCEGANFETMIVRSTVSERRRHVGFAKAFITWMRDAGFLWKGSAPRNILINHANRVVSIVDFERPLMLAETVGLREFDSFLVGTVHEEFSCFFLREEVGELFPTIWSWPQGNNRIRVTSSRQRKLIETVYGTTGELASPTAYAKTERRRSGRCRETVIRTSGSAWRRNRAIARPHHEHLPRLQVQD